MPSADPEAFMEIPYMSSTMLTGTPLPVSALTSPPAPPTQFVTGLSLAPQSASLSPQQVAYQEARAGREGYIHRVLVAFDQFANVLFVGSPDETISSRAERDAMKHELLARVLTRALDLFQSGHGQKAQAGDLERADTVASTEAQSLGVPEP